MFGRDVPRAPIYFHSLFDNMSEGVCLHEVIYDAQGAPLNYRILDVNPQYEAILRLPRAAVVGELDHRADRLDRQQLVGHRQPRQVDQRRAQSRGRQPSPVRRRR